MLTIIISAILSVFLGYPLFQKYISPRILGIISSPPIDVIVSGFINTKDITIKVYPEKRIPTIGNWATILDVNVQNCTTGQSHWILATASDATGTALLLVPSGQVILNDSYRFIVQGYSHLRRQYNCYTVNQVSGTYIDLTLENKDLLAGEVSPTYDNYINSLDLSALINKLYTGDYKTDLNQDGVVNSLDYSNQIYNLFVAGD